MQAINKRGHISSARIALAISPHIERGPLRHISGIIVHQTGGATRESSLTSYAKSKAMGAHFLIDHDGKIYQTASLFKQTSHVGRLRARCLVEQRCKAVELMALKRFDPQGEHRREMKKAVPERYPSNEDSLGIELVGAVDTPKGKSAAEFGTYRSVSPAQQDSLAWLIRELQETLKVPTSEIFRHPTVSRKNPSEAESALW